MAPFAFLALQPITSVQGTDVSLEMVSLWEAAGDDEFFSGATAALAGILVAAGADVSLTLTGAALVAFVFWADILPFFPHSPFVSSGTGPLLSPFLREGNDGGV